MSPKENFSVGIIGGADGPTAIYVSGEPLIWGIAAAAVILAAVGVVVYLCRRKKKEK